MIILPKKEVWTRQPQVPVGIDWSNPLSKGIVAVFNAAQQINNKYKTFSVGTLPTRQPSLSGVGIKSGYYTTPQYQTDSGGSGNAISACRTEHFVFDVLSNAVLQGLCSRGTSATDGGPRWLLQNNLGALRYYDGGAYRSCGTAVVGKRHVVSVVYDDFSPYPTKYYLNGVLITTVNAYTYQFTGTTIYIGSGYPTVSTNANFLLYVGKRGVRESDYDIARFASNPWQIFK